jgi:protein O-mannosyl-transferase
MASAFAALFFAVHPLRVESVAWATERRQLLATFFLFCALVAYLNAATTARGQAQARWRITALSLYGLSLLSEAAGVTFPIVLLVLDVYPLGRLVKRSSGKV